MKTYFAAAAITFVVLFASANSTQGSIVAIGDDIKLFDDVGTTGGIFKVDVLTKGASTDPYDFKTFCVQTQETIAFNTKYRVQNISTKTQGSAQNNVSLGSFAAWLYSGFLGVDGVSLPGFLVTDVMDVNAIQAGIWQSMGYSLPGGFSYDSTLLTSLHTLYHNDGVWSVGATSGVNEGTYIGSVKIMNLVTLNGQGSVTAQNQDQLVWTGTLPPPPGTSPAPEPMSFIVWSFLAMCVGGVSTQRCRNCA